MRALIAEDDAISRTLLQELLSAYGEIHAVEDGQKAIEAYCSAMDKGAPYELICLDIMMPEMDGQEVLAKIREMEEEKDIAPPHNAKIIMTTALGDTSHIMGAFKSQCDAYLIKPIDKTKLVEHLKSLGLIQGDA